MWEEDTPRPKLGPVPGGGRPNSSRERQRDRASVSPLFLRPMCNDPRAPRPRAEIRRWAARISLLEQTRTTAAIAGGVEGTQTGERGLGPPAPRERYAVLASWRHADEGGKSFGGTAPRPWERGRGRGALGERPMRHGPQPPLGLAPPNASVRADARTTRTGSNPQKLPIAA
jgi:hypothetical protein